MNLIVALCFLLLAPLVLTLGILLKQLRGLSQHAHKKVPALTHKPFPAQIPVQNRN